MSADNGIYVLKTLAQGVSGEPSARFEYRVAHASAIDNLYYDVETGEHRANFIPEMAYEYFGNAPIFLDEGEAFKHAFEEAEDYDVLEYGVSMLNHENQPFPSNLTPDDVERYEVEIDKVINRHRAQREIAHQEKLAAAKIVLQGGENFEPGAIYGYLIKPDGEKVHGSLHGVKSVSLSVNPGKEEVYFLPSDWHK